jgi:hypothetical protein
LTIMYDLAVRYSCCNWCKIITSSLSHEVNVGLGDVVTQTKQVLHDKRSLQWFVGLKRHHFPALDY